MRRADDPETNLVINLTQTDNTIEDIIRKNLHQTVRFLRFDGALLYSWVPDFNVLWPLTSCGKLTGPVAPVLRGFGVAGKTFSAATPSILEGAAISSTGEGWIQAENLRTIVALPLGEGTDIIGVLVLFSRRSVAIEKRTLRAVIVFGKQLYSAIRRAPLLATADMQRCQIEVITKIIATAATNKFVDEATFYGTMAREAQLLTGAHIVIFLRSNKIYAFGESQRGTTIRCFLSRFSLRLRRSHKKRCSTVLSSATGETKHALALLWRGVFPPTHQQRGLVELIATAVSAIEALRARVEMAESARRAQYLFDVSRALSISLDLRVVLGQIHNLYAPSSADSIAVVMHAPGDDTIAPPNFAEESSALWNIVRSASIADDSTNGCMRRGFEPPLEGEIAELVIVPLVYQGTIVGKIGFGRSLERGPASDDDRALYVTLASYAAAAIANAESFTKERAIADILQHALLPTVLPSDPRVLFSAAYVPAGSQAHVGGDWYDVFRLDSDRFTVSIGDVGGHGTYAATLMNVVRLALRTAAIGESDTVRVIERADSVLQMEHEPPMVTAIYGIIDVRRSVFTYTCAGHMPPLLAKSDGSVETLPTLGVPLGIGIASERRSYEAALAPGDTLVLYTDGLTEYGRDGIEGGRRLNAFLQELTRRRSHASFASDLHALTFGAGVIQYDDVAVLTVQMRPPALTRNELPPSVSSTNERAPQSCSKA